MIVRKHITLQLKENADEEDYVNCSQSPLPHALLGKKTSWTGKCYVPIDFGSSVGIVQSKLVSLPAVMIQIS